MIVCVDFDGTITEDLPRPVIAPIREDAIYYLNKLSDIGITLVLWTARSGIEYDDCISRLDESSLLNLFDFNYSECGSTGKLKADYYIDDRATVNFSWNDTYKHILKLKEELQNV